jgi:hypothetical protein
MILRQILLAALFVMLTLWLVIIILLNEFSGTIADVVGNDRAGHAIKQK